jgi:enediyne biosynthesis protein E4
MFRNALAAIWSTIVLVAAGADSIRYVDIAASANVTVPNTYGGTTRKDFILETTGTGAAIFDFDGDGDNDILIANGTRLDADRRSSTASLHLYRNDGKARFQEVGREHGFTVEGWAQAVCSADYDNDGQIDVFVTYFGHNRLFRNREGKFEDVTGAAGLPVTGKRYGSGCTFLDFDRDGRLDVFVSNYVDLDLEKTPKPGSAQTCKWKELDVMCGPQGLPLASNALYRNDGNGKFVDVSKSAGILKPGGRYGLGAATADFDNDGWPDIYVACDMTPSLLYRNRHDGTFEERGVEAGVAYNVNGQLQAGMGVAVADFDGDGLLDIAKTNFSGDLPSLFRNEDGRFFTDIAREAGLGTKQLLGWGIAFVDADADGLKDLIIANGHVYPEVDKSEVGDRYLQPTLLYRNLGKGRFQDATAASGPAFRTPRPARGLATGDLDGDGRPEVVIVNMNAIPSVLRNEVAGGSFVNVKLRGTKSNRSAIGARVTLKAGGSIQTDDLTSGASYYSTHEPTLHFGIGAASKVDIVEVRWPNGLRQKWENLPPNRTILLVEGEEGFK